MPTACSLKQRLRLLLLVLVLVAAKPQVSHCQLNGGLSPGPADPGSVDECDRVLQAVYSRQVEAANPLRLQGLWVSSSCETRPGPEFLVRRYQFANDTHFSALQIYFADSSCTEPLYGLEARGVVKLEDNAMMSGGILLGARPSAYELFSLPVLLQVTVMPYTAEAARSLQTRVTSELRCRKIFADSEDWSPARGPYHVLLYVEYRKKILRDFDCTRQLGFNLNEMQLIRVETAAPVPGASIRQLHLGDVATSYGERHSHRPTAFQQPLDDAKSPGCSQLCRRVASASLKQPPPPPLPQQPAWRALLPAYPAGEWASTVCESRPGGNYVTRRLLFEEAEPRQAGRRHGDSTSSNRSIAAAAWRGTYNHFHDPLCRQPYFSVTATGTVRPLGPAHPASLAARQFDFHIAGLAITPRDSRSLDQLAGYAGYGCGRSAAWRLNRSQDVTGTNGCDHFQLQVPATSQQTMTQEMLDGRRAWLFVGAISNSQGYQDQRPTSFQPPMVRCRELPAMAERDDDWLLPPPLPPKPQLPSAPSSSSSSASAAAAAASDSAAAVPQSASALLLLLPLLLLLGARACC